MTYLGLLFEVLFLAAGIYLYLFTRGVIDTKQGNTFLEDNKTLLRFASLALIAVMLINIILHIKDLVA